MPLLRAKEETLWLAKLAKSSHEATADGSSGFISAAIAKPKNHLGETVLAAMRPLDLQTTYQQMIEWGLSARTVRYTHVVLRSAMRQALQWRLLLENPADGVKIPQQSRGRNA